MRELKKINVNFISLVKRPANKKALILKSKDWNTIQLVKFDNEMQRAYAIVYTPDEVDSQGDWAQSPVILDAANEFMKSGRTQSIDIEHSFVPSSDAYVAESWIVKEKDPMFPGEVGAWAVAIQVESDQIWKDLKKGNIAGVSMAGYGIYKKEDVMDEDTKKALDAIASSVEEINKSQQLLAAAIQGKSTDADQGKSTDADTLMKGFKDIADALKDKGGSHDSGLQDSAAIEKRIADTVQEAVDKAKTDNLTEITKTLAEALAKGRTESGIGERICSEMI